MKVLVSSAKIGHVCGNRVVNQPDYVDFRCFDSKNFPSREKSLHNRMIGKIPKMLSWDLHPEYDIYIWMDSYFNITQKGAIEWFMSQLENKKAAFFRHPTRKSIKQEGDFLINECNKKNEYIKDRCLGEDIKGQLDRYLPNPEFKDELLLAASSFIYSKELVNNPDWNPLKDWFYEVCRWNIRDQVSLPYILNKWKVDYNIIEENVFNCKYLK